MLLFCTFVLTPMTLANEQPKPSLYWLDDDLEGCESEANFSLCNSSIDPKDIAVGVIIDISVIEGSEYVDKIEYVSCIGTIPPATCVPVHLKIITKANWNFVPIGTEIKVKLVVTGEGNWPERNADGHVKAHYTFKQCTQCIKVSVDATKIHYDTRKPGWFKSSYSSTTVTSGGSVKLCFGGSVDNPASPDGEIETWYSIGGVWKIASDLAGYEYTFINPVGQTLDIQIKFHISSATSPGTYSNAFNLTFYPEI